VPSGSSTKRERQYEHIKASEEKRGEKRAAEIAARTVNKERARSGETKTARRGSASEGPTYDQLYQQAKQRNIKGRSSMNKKELQRALGKG